MNSISLNNISANSFQILLSFSYFFPVAFALLTCQERDESLATLFETKLSFYHVLFEEAPCLGVI